MEKVPITQKGYDRLVAELKQLKSVERPRIIAAISEARAHGDLSENAEYHAAKEQQGLNESRIQELDDMSSRAEVIDVSQFSGDQVRFGAHIMVRNETDDREHRWQIVGHYEADATAGLLSVMSPMARALIGRKKGDVVSVHAPGGEKDYTILQVEYK
ncbi:MAG: transcription elongation factor GreA [Hyphomicrobiales bacterium]|nr:transcription elongation factor GreA [Hyphomicrobiales bacterium]